MAHNDEVGGSNSAAAEDANRYLDYLISQEGSQGTLRIQEGGDGADTTDGIETDIDGGNRTTDGGSQATQKKRIRSANKLGTGRLDVHSVHPGTGEPISPRAVSAGYGNNLACILRETVSINETNIREDNKEHLQMLLLTKLHQRYKFPDWRADVDPTTDPNMDRINQKALKKFSKDLSAWKNRVREAMAKEGSCYATIKAKWPMITEEDYEQFKATSADPVTKDKSKHFKDLQAKNIAPHRLGTRGYTGKRPKWDKEDAERERLQQADPFAEFTDPQERDFIRARYTKVKETGEWVTDEATRDFIRLLVIINFLP